MQVASSDSFHALLQSTLRSLHVAGVINDVEISDIGSLSCRVSHYPTKSSKKKKGPTPTPPVPSWATSKKEVFRKEPSASTSSSAQTPDQWRPIWLLGECRYEFAFKEELGMFGKIEDVTGDGNCGFYAILLGLERMKIVQRKTITFFRKQIFEYAQTNQTAIADVAIPEAMRNCLVGGTFTWEGDVLGPLYRQEGPSYETGCPSSNWIRGEWHFPILAYMFQVTLVVYSTSENKKKRENGDLMHHKSTFIYFPNGESEHVSRHLPPPNTLSQVDNGSTIFLVHINNVHYLHLSIPV
jgi:hypothetical protein